MKLSFVGVFLMVFILLLLFVVYYIRYKNIIDYTLIESEKRTLDYFNEIALNSEFYNNPKRIIKWNENMKLYVSLNQEQNIQYEFIKSVIKHINSITIGHNFSIELVNDSTESNAVLYLCNLEEIAKKDLQFYNKFSYETIGIEVSGFTYLYCNSNTFNIDWVKIFIDTKDTIEVQLSTILEELTHSIGLPNDSRKYKSSIFYEDKDIYNLNPTIYSELDREIIQLLYHPNIKAGMSSKEARREITKIFWERSKEKGSLGYTD